MKGSIICLCFRPQLFAEGESLSENIHRHDDNVNIQKYSINIHSGDYFKKFKNHSKNINNQSKNALTYAVGDYRIIIRGSLTNQFSIIRRPRTVYSKAEGL